MTRLISRPIEFVPTLFLCLSTWSKTLLYGKKPSEKWSTLNFCATRNSWFKYDVKQICFGLEHFTNAANESLKWNSQRRSMVHVFWSYPCSKAKMALRFFGSFDPCSSSLNLECRALVPAPSSDESLSLVSEYSFESDNNKTCHHKSGDWRIPNSKITRSTRNRTLFQGYSRSNLHSSNCLGMTRGRKECKSEYNGFTFWIFNVLWFSSRPFLR